MSAVQQMLVAYGAGAACDPYFAYVSLLLHMDGSNGSTTFTDNSPSPKTMTANGNAQVNTSVVKYGTGSASFDGSGDWISTPNIAAARFNTGDFTIECWIYISSFASGTAQTVVNQRNVSGGNGWSLVVDQDGYLFFQATGGTPNYIISAAGAIALNTWYYVAVTRSGSVSRLFINGTQVDSSTTLTIGATTSEELRMGRASQGVFNYELTGYVDDLRLTNGIARYTANFTPPAAAFPDIICAGGDPYYYSVKLLLHMDGSNGSTTFTDNSPSPKTLTPSGNAQVNTSVVKYGTGSYVGDGSGDYLTVTVPGGLGASDFTIEYWMYLTADTGYLFNSRTSGTGSDGIDIAVRAQVSTSGSNIFGQYGGFALNTWIYVAIVRQGSSWYRFFNGTLYDTASNSGNFTGTDFKIGGSPHGNVGYINGYIDDFRITVGVARYTTNFTPPTGPFPNS